MAKQWKWFWLRIKSISKGAFEKWRTKSIVKNFSRKENEIKTYSRNRMKKKKIK